VDIIEDIGEIRELYGEPSERAVKKQLTKLEKHSRAFIALSPFLVIASSDTSGRVDASPKGDAPGFVHVLDDETLLIPDRLGNNRIDTISNLLASPGVGLIFFVPGLRETLRVNGRASITTDPATRESVIQFKASLVPKGRSMDWALRDGARKFLVPLFEGVRSQAERN